MLNLYHTSIDDGGWGWGVGVMAVSVKKIDKTSMRGVISVFSTPHPFFPPSRKNGEETSGVVGGGKRGRQENEILEKHSTLRVSSVVQGMTSVSWVLFLPLLPFLHPAPSPT